MIRIMFRPRMGSKTELDQATPAPVLSEASLGVVSHTAIRQATQSVMKYIARKTTKLAYPPHSYSTNSPIRYASTSPAATRAKNQMIRAILMSPPVGVAPADCHGYWRVTGSAVIYPSRVA